MRITNNASGASEQSARRLRRDHRHKLRQRPMRQPPHRVLAMLKDVDFPLTDKQEVIGSRAHPFFRWIAAELGDAGTPRWNFHKYLIAPDGTLAGAWPSRVRPTDKEITGEIEALLAK